MSDFNKKKVMVELEDDITIDAPIIPRKYTLTHNDENGDLYLNIGKCYDYSNVSSLRDEVIGSWSCKDNGEYILNLEVLLDGCGNIDVTEQRNKIFRKELPIAIKAIVYGDRKLFDAYEVLNESKIYVKFKSKHHKYNVEEPWGCIKDYKEDSNNRSIIIEDVNELNRIKKENINRAINFDYFKPMPIGGNMINYPMPFPPGVNYNNQQVPKNKNFIVEKALINVLSPYIKNQVDLTMGKNTKFCLREADVLNARMVSTYAPCREEYEVTIGVRAGERPPQYYNVIITFLIKENKVIVKDTKNPRNGI